MESNYSEQEAQEEKLLELQAQGKDPFDVYKVERTHMSEEIKANFKNRRKDCYCWVESCLKRTGKGSFLRHTR